MVGLPHCSYSYDEPWSICLGGALTLNITKIQASISLKRKRFALTQPMHDLNP